MNVIVILTAMLVLVGAGPAAAQSNTKDSKGGTLGGVLDTLGGILGGGSSKLHGSVVTANDTTLVLRTDDQRTVRVDTASIDPKVRQQLTSGQSVTVTARGAGGDVIAASDVQVEPGKSATQSFPYSVWRKSFTPGSPVNLPRVNSTAAPGYLVVAE